MNRFDFTNNNIDYIIAIGDIHGDFSTMIYSLRKFTSSLIIVCGDCGFGFNKLQHYLDALKKLNKECYERNNIICFIRGNHDDPIYFSDRLINFSNMMTIPDYSIITNKKDNILCVGGAISIDRKWRIEKEIIANLHKDANSKNRKKLYWENEQIIYDENILNEIVNEKININIIATHSAPHVCPPYNKNGIQAWMSIDSKLEKDLEEERNNLDKLLAFSKKNFNVKKWVYGHFHELNDASYKNVFDGIEFRMIRNIESMSSRGFDYEILSGKNYEKEIYNKCDYLSTPNW